MKKATLILAGLVGIVLAGCGGSSDKPAPRAARPVDQIVGKWQVAEGTAEDTIQFAPDGKMRMTSEGEAAIDGRYQFVAEDNVEVEFVPPGEKAAVKMRVKVKVDGDTLETTDKDNATDKFKRVH